MADMNPQFLIGAAFYVIIKWNGYYRWLTIIYIAQDTHFLCGS